MFRKLRELFAPTNDIRSDEDVSVWAVRTSSDAIRLLSSGRQHMVEIGWIKPDDPRPLSELQLCVDVHPMYQKLASRGYEVITPSCGWLGNVSTKRRRGHCFAWHPQTDEVVDYTAPQIIETPASLPGSRVQHLIACAPQNTTELIKDKVVVLHGRREIIRRQTGLEYIVPKDEFC